MMIFVVIPRMMKRFLQKFKNSIAACHDKKNASNGWLISQNVHTAWQETFHKTNMRSS